jgi:hypothetical protein
MLTGEMWTGFIQMILAAQAHLRPLCLIGYRFKWKNVFGEGSKDGELGE